MESETIDNPSRLSGLLSRNICVLNRRTSVRLEPEIWQALRDISVRERCSIHILCSLIAKRKRVDSSLTAAIRVFVTLYYRAAATDVGHIQAGHGGLGQLAKSVLKCCDDRFFFNGQVMDGAAKSVG